MTTTREATETPPEIFERRRAAACSALGDGVLVLTAAPVQLSSRDTERRYHPDRELYYLTGVTEPETVAVLVGGDDPELALFVRERDPAAELWAGPRPGPEGIAARHGIERCRGLSELTEHLPALLQRGDRIHYRLGAGGPVEDAVLAALAHARMRGSRRGEGPRGIVDPGEVLDDLRLVKDQHELARMRRAADISLLGHRAGLCAIEPGAGEWMVEAAIDGAFRAAGAHGPAYETIVGSGANACVLHYVANAATLEPDALVLVDAGAEHGLYHGDVTRTWPVSGRFQPRQREIYDLVEVARAAGVAAVAPGRTIGDVHDAVVAALVEGLVGLGVLGGSIDEAIETESYKTFFPHQTSHWLGLDVHDPGDYARDGRSRRLEPGMVFTVEPGLYFGAGVDEGDGAAVPRPGEVEGGERRPRERARGKRADGGAGTAAAYAGIGVRIEDEVVVTEGGCEVLTAALPTAAAEVEALVGRRG